MVRIFSKLKLIISLTVIFITLLFAMLIYTQYASHEHDVDVISAEMHQDLGKDLESAETLYQETSSLLYSEFIEDEADILRIIDGYPTNPSFNQDHKDQLMALLAPITVKATDHGFQAVSILLNDGESTQILMLPESDSTEITKDILYPLTSKRRTVGFLVFHLPYSSICSTLDDATMQQSFLLFNRESIEDVVYDETLYTSAAISDDYTTDISVMKSMYQVMNSHDQVVLEAFQREVDEDVLQALKNNWNHTTHQKIGNTFYSMVFVTLTTSDDTPLGYFAHFRSNNTLGSLEDSLILNVSLFAVLYIILLVVIGFIYYILHYLYNFSYTDNLTRIYNRHKFFEVIKHNIYEYHRYNYMFSVILIDIDNFKTINDSLGHNVGDDVLVDFAGVLTTSLRTSDYLFRWGGEEFLVLLSHCEGKTAYQVAEKLRLRIDQHDFKLKSGYNVTASFGVASYKNSTNIEAMVSHADQALYDSKNAGKNCTTLYMSQPNGI